MWSRDTSIVTAACKIVGNGNVVGVQRVNSLWLIYLKDRTSRLQLYTKGNIVVKGKLIQLYDENPFTTRNQQQRNEKLTIKNLPLSVNNEDIKAMLQEKNIQLASAIRYGYIRDHDGQFTQYRSGDRYVYVKPFNPPIDRKQKVGDTPCLIIHHGKEMTCSACGVAGHRVGDETCDAKPTEKIVAFRGYQHPLSNHYACDLSIYNNTFKSVEHAFFHQMALDMKNPTLANKIKNAKHAGMAKRLSKSIASDDERYDWERKNTHVMDELLNAKLEQCPAFSQCLYENRDAIIAEATPSKIWGTGLSPHATVNTAPKYWTGQNILGSLLTDLAKQVSEKAPASENAPAPEPQLVGDNAEEDEYETEDTEAEIGQNEEINPGRRLRSGNNTVRSPNTSTSSKTKHISKNTSNTKTVKRAPAKKKPKQKKSNNDSTQTNRDIRQMFSPQNQHRNTVPSGESKTLDTSQTNTDGESQSENKDT